MWSCRPPEPAGGTETEESAAAASRGRVINVETWLVTLSDFTEEIRLTGVAQASRDAVIAAQEQGTIREIYVAEGSRVAQGDPLVKIDDEVLAAQVDQARAAHELASETWERRRRLFEADSVGSEIDYLDARYAAEQAAASYRSLAARLERTTVRAPFAGIVETRAVELGESVTQGQPVARLVDLGSAKVLAGVPERYSSDVRPGDRAKVIFDVLDDEFSVPVGRVGSTVDPRSRTFQVEMAIPNTGARIKPEMVANVSLVRRELLGVVVVPREVVVRVADGYVAYVVRDAGDGGTVAEVEPVSLGPTEENVVVVQSGLAEGDRLIVVGHRSVADGDAVNVVAERR